MQSLAFVQLIFFSFNLIFSCHVTNQGITVCFIQSVKTRWA
ncbi:hypothetical protein DYY67_0770 [Candidatus Nitrosotalea sp. TS]|nr:hypothetical protein [Candidatus Nitrosotalea sp. TS]